MRKCQDCGKEIYVYRFRCSDCKDKRLKELRDNKEFKELVDNPVNLDSIDEGSFKTHLKDKGNRDITPGQIKNKKKHNWYRA